MQNITRTLILLIFVAIGCKNSQSEQVKTPEKDNNNNIEKTHYGVTKSGESVDKYSLINTNGMQVDVITYGGIITSWSASDKSGKYQNIVLGYDSLSQYERNNPYFGAIIGRYGNRIAKGKFSIDGQTYTLETNDNMNHLHGGTKGFDKVVWTVDDVSKDDNGSAITLSYISKDMEMGYPGTLQTKVTYMLDNQDALHVSYEAITDKKTIVNLTQHTYFNLSGDFHKTILDHEILLVADKYLPVDAGLIPTGQLADVKGTPFDFITSKTIGKDIDSKDEQLALGKGYDHCWVLTGNGMRSAATVHHPSSGRVLEILTDEPAIQFYTGNFLDGSLPMPGGGKYAFRTGFCLETQHYPDSPNQKHFPSTLLEPGQIYKSKTIFKFSKK